MHVPDFYSSILGAALVAVALAAAALLIDRFRLRTSWSRTLAVRGAGTALVLGTVAGCVHLLGGHRPGSPSALGWAGFLAQHPALVAITAASVAVIPLSRAVRPGRSGVRRLQDP